jgi:DNA primase large subunit
MFRTDTPRTDSKRHAKLDPKRKQFATTPLKPIEYLHRLNSYDSPPTSEITLEQFEQWAIDRLRSAIYLPHCGLRLERLATANTTIVLSELETCSFRNKTAAETAAHLEPLLKKYLPLSPNTAMSSSQTIERQKDHYSHFILRLAFSRTEDLRRRFLKLETALFRMRFARDDAKERARFVESLNLEWEVVGEAERVALAKELLAAGGGSKEDGGWFKVEWERVPELVEMRKVLLKEGKAYVPMREQLSLVVAEFSSRLEKALEVRYPRHPTIRGYVLTSAP